MSMENSLFPKIHTAFAFKDFQKQTKNADYKKFDSSQLDKWLLSGAVLLLKLNSGIFKNKGLSAHPRTFSFVFHIRQLIFVNFNETGDFMKSILRNRSHIFL